MPGSKVSPADLAQYLVIDAGIRKRSSQVCILLFKFLQSLGLINLQATILLAPAEVGLLRDAKLAADFGHRFALRNLWMMSSDVNRFLGIV